MIPKIIHYTWFSGDPFPESIQKCIDTWKKWMPDYDFRLWDMASIQDIDSVFLTEALKERKWAFAADVVRLYAVYNEGGIYLDTDVEVYRTFDSLLNIPAFIGRENSIHVHGCNTDVYLSSHCFGAEKGHPFIGRCLDYYNGRHFITSNDQSLPMSLKYDTTLLPFIQSELASQLGYDSSALMNVKQICKDDLVILPSYYFDAVSRKEETICRHLAIGSWRETSRKDIPCTLKYKIKWRIEYMIREFLGGLGYLMIEKR